MKYTEQNGIGVFLSEILSSHGIVHGFTTRIFPHCDMPSISPRDISSNLDPINNLISSFGLENSKLVFQKQIHGDTIKIIRNSDLIDQITLIENNDAMISSDPGVCMFSHSADCMSLIIAHPESGTAGIAHCGRKGVILNLPSKLAMKMCDHFSLIPSDLYAVMGSTISLLCYEVGESVVNEIKQLDPSAFGFLIRKNSKQYFDIRGFALFQLTNLGIPRENIDYIPLCSHCNDNLFYSYRRDGESIGYQSGFIVSGKSD